MISKRHSLTTDQMEFQVWNNAAASKVEKAEYNRMTKRDKAKVAMWSVLRIFLGERDEADFASDCRPVREGCVVLKRLHVLSHA